MDFVVLVIILIPTPAMLSRGHLGWYLFIILHMYAKRQKKNRIKKIMHIIIGMRLTAMVAIVGQFGMIAKVKGKEHRVRILFS